MADRRIVLVGGGSVTWTPTILCNLLANPLLAGSHLVLHDTDAEALALAYQLTRKCRQRNAGFTFSQTTNQEKALAGADFVLVTITTGGLATMRPDLEIPERYGVFQTVGDTTGPGGLSRALRSIPVFLGIARTMERVCPQAWMINLTNPLTTLTRAVTKETSIRALGSCCGVAGVAQQYAAFFGVPLEQCAYVNAGIDHCSWFTEFRVQGRPAGELLAARGLDAWLARSPAEAAADPVFAPLSSLRCGLVLGRSLGALPAIGDRHLTEFFPGFLCDCETVKRHGLVRTSIADRERYYVEFRGVLEEMIGSGRPLFGESGADVVGQPHGDDLAAWIVALSGGPRVEDNISGPNLGQIPELPLGAVVETRGVLDCAGFHPLASPLPGPLAAAVHPHVLRCELIVEAALEGSREKALSALATDPLLSRPEAAPQLLDELLAANREWLPQFS